MAEDTHTPETQGVPKTAQALKESVRQRVEAAKLPSGAMADHIIHQIYQKIDSVPSNDIGLVAASAFAAVDIAIAVARDGQQQTDLEARKTSISKIMEERFAQEMEQQQALKAMEARLQASQMAWNSSLEDEDRLNARMKRKEALDETVLMGMDPERLRRLEALERAELYALEANLERQKEMVRKEEKEVVDTGRKLGVRGEDRHVLHTMEEAAEGRNAITLTDAQARLVSGVKTHREHTATQAKAVETQKQRVETVGKVIDKRGLTHATLTEVQREIKAVCKEENLDAELEGKMLERAQVANVMDIEARNKDIEARNKEVEAKSKELLAMSGLMVGKFNITVPAKDHSPTMEEYAQAFMAKANGPNCPEALKTRLLGLSGKLMATQEEKMKLLAREAAQEMTANKGPQEKIDGNVGKHSQTFQPGARGAPERKDNGWQR